MSQPGRTAFGGGLNGTHLAIGFSDTPSTSTTLLTALDVWRPLAQRDMPAP